jgi:hypothetical protein
MVLSNGDALAVDDRADEREGMTPVQEPEGRKKRRASRAASRPGDGKPVPEAAPEGQEPEEQERPLKYFFGKSGPKPENQLKKGKVSKTDEQKDLKLVQESNNSTKKRRVTKSVEESVVEVSEAAPKIKIKKKPRSRPKIKQDGQNSGQEQGAEKAAEEQALAGAAVESAPEEQKSEEPELVYGHYEGHAEPAPNESNTPAESATVPAQSSAQEKESTQAQKTDLPSNEQNAQEAMESGWKFDEQKSSEHSEEHILKEDYKESGAASAEQEHASHTSEGSADAKTSNVDVYKEQKTVETTEKHTLRNALIALVIIAVLCLLALYLWHHVSIKLPPAKITFTTTLSTSSTSIVPPPATQVRNLTANAATNPNSGNSTVHISGIISPPPKSANSMVIISIVGPRGASMGTAETPVSNSGAFNTDMVLGNAGSLSNGTYTVTSDYYGASGRTTFVLAAVPYNSPNWMVNTLCNIYNEVHSMVFLLSILLVVLGAAVYAFGHVMPGAHKGQFQGYGMGMVIGGVVGTIIAVIVPYIVRIIAAGALPIASCISGLV